MKIAEAFVELRVDDRRAQAEVRQRATSLGGTFAQFFGAAAFGAGAKKAIDAASAFEQSLGAIESVLGRNSVAVKKWAEDAARSMGLSKTAANNALVLMAAQLKNFGFSLDEATEKGMDLVQLGADMAATFGGSTTDAVQALTAALRGEMDPIERYGVSLNEARVKAKALELGLYSGVGALDANAKAQAVLALILEQTASAQGQFAREAHSAAGAQAIASAEAENSAAAYGEKLLPVYTRVMEVVGKLAEGFALLPAPLQYAVIGLTAYAALSGPLKALGETVRAVSTRIQGMSTASKAMIGITAVAGVALVALSYRAQKAAEAEREMADAIAELSRVADEEVLAAFARALVKAAMAGEDVVDVGERMAEQNLEGTKRLRDQIAARVESGVATEQETRWLEMLTVAIDEEDRAREQAAETNERYADGIDATTTKTDDLADATKELEDAFASLVEELDLRDATRNVAEGFDRITDAYNSIWDATDDRPLEEKIRDWEQAVDDQKRSVIDWATEIGNVPTEALTEIMALIDEGSFDEVERRMAEFERKLRVSYSASADSTGMIRIGQNGKVASFDVGGFIDRDQMAMVHRNEVVLPLNSPGRVAALLGDPRVAPVVAGAMGGPGQSGASLSIGTLNVGSRDDLGATTNELDRILWRVS